MLAQSESHKVDGTEEMALQGSHEKNDNEASSESQNAGRRHRIGGCHFGGRQVQ
jgi:hypothetical protein